MNKRKGQFYVQIGLHKYYFATLEKAENCANEVFRRTGTVLGIFAVPGHRVK